MMKTEQTTPTPTTTPIEIAKEIIAHVDATTVGWDDITTERLERETAEIISRYLAKIWA